MIGAKENKKTAQFSAFFFFFWVFPFLLFLGFWSGGEEVGFIGKEGESGDSVRGMSVRKIEGKGGETGQVKVGRVLLFD